MSKKILIWPDALLKERSQEITDFGPELFALINDLKATLLENPEPMAGLAAPQIGVSKRVFLMDIPPEDNDGNGTDGLEVFINPEFYGEEGRFSWEEGCMSIPGLRGKVTRHDRIMMRWQDESGAFKEREAFFYLSGCFQHELDHLNGVVWVDYQSALKKSMIKRKMLAYKKQNDLTGQ